MLPVDGGEKTENTFMMLASHGRDAECKSKEVLFVVCDHMKQQYYELEIMIKRYQSISTLSNDQFKKIKKCVTKALTTRFYQWSLVVQGGQKIKL